VVCIPISPEERGYSEEIAARLRSVGLRVVVPLEDAKLKNELKRAVRRGAAVAAIAGGDERARSVVSLRDLAASETQEVGLDQVAAAVRKIVDRS
jgi:histidyl-tRNA synthetase